MAQICKQAPEFDCVALMPDQQFGNIKLSELLNKNEWIVLFFYPLDFTFVCPTEICTFSDKAGEFKKLSCRVIGASVDSQYTHFAWSNQERKKGGIGKLNIPLLADVTRKVCRDYGVLLDDGHSCRATFIIDPKGCVRHMSFNDPPVGRSVDEILRLVEGYQYFEEHGNVCPAGWNKKNKKTIKPNPKEKLEYFQSQ
mmetsp:Transcript_68499/g.61545  ORF Transcript_68499/g.61545 Transcript_68499/m.61545 type:complete len:197 (-) Transcript_68499:103-693(-)